MGDHRAGRVDADRQPLGHDDGEGHLLALEHDRRLQEPAHHGVRGHHHLHVHLGGLPLVGHLVCVASSREQVYPCYCTAMQTLQR